MLKITILSKNLILIFYLFTDLVDTLYIHYIYKVHSYTQLSQALCQIAVITHSRQHYCPTVSTPPPS